MESSRGARVRRSAILDRQRAMHALHGNNMGMNLLGCEVKGGWVAAALNDPVDLDMVVLRILLERSGGVPDDMEDDLEPPQAARRKQAALPGLH